MSSKSSAFIFFLCLCSLHACNGGRFRLIDSGDSGRQLSFPTKVVGKVEEEVKMDSSKKEGEFGDSSGYDKDSGGAMITQELMGMKYRRGDQVKISGSIPLKPLDSVSNSNSHDPQDNVRDEHINPGIYSDYSRPRSRPPSHN